MPEASSRRVRWGPFVVITTAAACAAAGGVAAWLLLGMEEFRAEIDAAD